MQKIRKGNKGITLIALVVTIIVLLILAGISISMLTGENGILGRARQARDNTKQSETEENIKMAYNSATMTDYVEGTESFKDTFKSELEGYYGTGKVTVEDGQDGNSYDVTIEGEGAYTVDKKKGTVTKKIDAKYIPKATYIIGENANSTEDINGKGKIEKNDTSKFYVIVTTSVESGTISSVEGGEGLTEEESNPTSDGKYVFSAKEEKDYTVTVKSNEGKEYEQTITVTISAFGVYKIAYVPGNWILANQNNNGNDWYAYTRVTKEGKDNGIGEINEPILEGGMKAIKYSKKLDEISTTETGYTSRWANAVTTDGSMWVWIPRYAYKITYTGTEPTTRAEGTIDVVFVDINNKPLGLSSDGNTVNEGDITDKPEEAGTSKYLVHPAFSSDAEIGGGFGKDGKGITGFWFAKFETSGTISDTESTMKSVGGVTSLRTQTIGKFYESALKQKYGETTDGDASFGDSHMVKNSEWGAVAYLSESKYGTDGKSVDKNSNTGYYTGGISGTNNNEQAKIYETNYKQSTTRNAYGVYDMSGGAYEYVASYVNNGKSYLTTYGGKMTQDETSGTSEEYIKTSTKYKTVYQQGTSDSRQNNYEKNKDVKGDAVYETSSSGDSTNAAWHSAYAYFPYDSCPFFERGGACGSSLPGVFSFSNISGSAGGGHSCRLALVL